MHATPGRAQSQAETAGPTPTFESFSIQPSREVSAPRPNPLIGSHQTRMMYGPDSFVANNVTLRALIEEAYGVQANQISGPADLLTSPTYDVAAKANSASGTKFGPGYGNNAGQLALQAALAEHTKLVVHHETKELPIYALVIAEDGTKLQPSQSAEPAGDNKKIGMRMLLKGEGQDSTVEARAVTTDDLARQLSLQLGIAVVNKTRLKGPYNFDLRWTQNPSQSSDKAETAADNSTAPETSLLTALQQQLGLKLEPQKQPMDIIVIDHIEQPAAD
jgi:bla regulator protein blaR1